jgi:predicted nuclease with TOPRIM domain
MQEIVRSRSQSQNELSASVASDIITQAEESIPPAPDQNHGINKEELLSQLQGLMSEVTALNEEVNKRRKESSEIRDLFEERCRGLTRSVAELEDEVLEL